MPATKAALGEHDENIDLSQAAQIVGGRELLDEIRRVSLELYSRAESLARSRGIILADTKFEFGWDGNSLVLADEVLTPDSSRFWPSDTYKPGSPQPSFDKQFVRYWASGSGWDKTDPAPAIPDEVVAGTSARYVEAYERLTGESFDLNLTEAAHPIRRVRVLIRPKEGSSTPRVRRSSARCRRSATRASRTCMWAGWSSWTYRRAATSRRASSEMCERLLANPLIESYEVQPLTTMARSASSFPGLLRRGRCRPRGARTPGLEPRYLWHGDADLSGVDAVVVPGGFSYGDYLRAGAIARFSPDDGAGRALRRRGRPGARHLQRLPGAVRGGPAARRAAAEHLAALRVPPGRRAWSSTPTALHRRPRRRARPLSLPVKHTFGRWYAPDDQLDALEAQRPAGAALRPGHNPNGSLRDIAGVTNEQGNVLGLMPHPEHAVDELNGSADAPRLFGSLAATLRALSPAAA